MTTDLFTVDPWTHQSEGVEQVIAALLNGTQSVCLTSPTGSGKTAMEIALARWAQERSVLVLTNRILLTEQTRRVFRDSGVPVGVISSSMKQYERTDCDVQIATIQTILARRRADSDYWIDASLVLVDEIHQQATGESADLLEEYKRRGSHVCGVTATPLGVSSVCDELIVAGRTRDLQDSGILTFALWFAPLELDTRKLVKGKVDLSLSENDARKTWGPLRGDDKIRTRIVGPILDYYKKLHSELTHTLAFAPGVKESIWAARYCHNHGIRSLHIDGENFWCDGVMYDRKESDQKFQEHMQEWRDGMIPIIWNRFVMREGIDEPRIKCILLATPVGSYRSFLQMVGRGLRTHVSKNRCIVIDYGGNWWRHGSVNVNVDWESVFECSDPDVLSKNRIAKLRETGDEVGFGCPQCGIIIDAKKRITTCPHCGHEFKGRPKSRPIVQADGKIVQVNGNPIKQWKIKNTPEAEKIWSGLYWNAVKKHGGEVSFSELYQQFFYNSACQAKFNEVYERTGGDKAAALAESRSRPAFWHAYYPPRDSKLMPVNQNDWHRKVGKVAMDKLRSESDHV